jgi:hypothetical protein
VDSYGLTDDIPEPGSGHGLGPIWGTPALGEPDMPEFASPDADITDPENREPPEMAPGLEELDR